MGEYDESDCKPMADIKRERHCSDSKRHGIHGKTVKKRQDGLCFSARVELTSSNDCRCISCFGKEKRRLYTAIELEGRDTSHSLDRDLAWEHVPALLREHAICQPAVVKMTDGTIKTTFQLEPLVEEVHVESADDGVCNHFRRPRATDGKLYRLKNGKRPTLFAVPPAAPPEDVARGNAKLLMPVRMGDSRSVRTFPLVRRDSGAVWDVTRHGGVGRARLDIDLGSDVLVSHIATQGRPPPTRVYPQVRRERRRERADLLGLRHDRVAGLGRRAIRANAARRREEADEEESGVGDGYWVEGRRWDLLRQGQYPGPFWDVLSLKGDEERCKRTGRAYTPGERWLQWVSRYEVHYRVEGGRRWHVLGAFHGNVDATSEVAHDVRGLRARFLRIVPLEAQGLGALRVGVYGQSAAPAAAASFGVVHAVAGNDGAEEAPEPIRYTLRRLGERLNTRYSYCERHTRNYHDHYGVEAPKSVRLGRRLHAWREEAEEAEEAGQEDMLVAAEAQEARLDARDDAAAGVGGAAPTQLTMAVWVDDELQRKRAAAAAAVEGLDEWSVADSEAWSEAAWSEAAWSEAAWSVLSEEEQWLQVLAFEEVDEEEGGVAV